MALSYPDVLVSSVLEVLRGVRDIASERPDRKSFRSKLRRLLGTKDEVQKTIDALDRAIENLWQLRHIPDNRVVEWTRTAGSKSAVDAIGSIKVGPLKSELRGGVSESESSTAVETVVSSKEEYLERSLDESRTLLEVGLRDIDGGFVFLDEFYRVTRSDQPRVLGYMHRLLKDTGLWLKVASVRYWTVPYKGGSTPQGLQLTQDANEVSLDRGLQLFELTKNFLEQIFESIANRAGVELSSLMTDGALTRLVVASGGVPRDYLRLARESIKQARNRGPTEKQGSGKVMAEDVNSAAGQTAETKLDDLREDAPGAAAELERLLEDIGEFCRYNKVAYFMVDSRDQELTGQVDQLQDLRFVHLLFNGETVPNAGSRRHRVLLLDVAYLSFKRARQVDFEGWTDREKRRSTRLIYTKGAGDAAARQNAIQSSPNAPPVEPQAEPTMSMFENEEGSV